MGNTLGSLLPSRKRRRSDSAGDGRASSSGSEGAPQNPTPHPKNDPTSCGDAVSDAQGAAPSPLAEHLLSLRYSSSSEGGRVGVPVCRCVDDGAAMRQAYGCHAHLYETPTAAESHGVALAWCVADDAPLSPLSLLSLCRVANSCRKKTLLTTQGGEALLLTYTATL